jgi:putative membrane protein
MRKSLYLSIAAALALVLAMSSLPARVAAADSDKPSVSDKEFLQQAYQNLYIENEITRLARERSRSEGVKHYAELQIGGNRKMIDEIRDFAHKHNIPLDEDMSRKQRHQYDKFSKLEGQEFDEQYMANEVEDQRSLYELFGNASKEARDPDLREFAKDKAQVLREHLSNAEELYRKVKAKQDR